MTRVADAVAKRSARATFAAPALVVALVLAVLAAGAALAWYTAFGTYAPYDDEGYFQAALARVHGGARLYDDVATPYGPAWFGARELVHGALGVPLTTDGVRLALLPAWFAAALACAALAAACVRERALRMPLALLAFACLLSHLRALANEPGHPQDVGLLFALVALLAATWSRRRSARATRESGDPRELHRASSASDDAGRARSRTASVVTGVAWALTTLTKVNVGGLSGLALVAHASHRRIWRSAALVAGLALPWVLIRARIDELECVALALASNVAWGTSIAARRVPNDGAHGATNDDAGPVPGDEMHPTTRTSVRGLEPVACGVAALVTVVASVAWLVARGSSASAIVASVLVAPLRFTSEIERVLDVPVLGSVSALASLVVFVVVRRSGRAVGARAKLAFGALAVALGLAEPGAAVAFVLPWAWVALGVGRMHERSEVEGRTIPTSFEAHPESAFAADGSSAIALLALTAALFPLQVFPVSGTQLVLGVLPLVVLGLVALADAVAESAGERARTLAWFAAACGLVAITTSASSARSAYLERDVLPLEGATRTRFDELWGARQACLAATLRASDAAFFSVRGDHSLHAWVGRRPPSNVLVSHAFGVLSAEQHAELVSDCRSSTRLLVLDQPGRWSAATRADVPLLAFVDAELVPGGRLRTDVLMHRRDAPPPRWTRCALLATPAALVLDLRLPAGDSLARARRAVIVDGERGVVLADSADRTQGIQIDVERNVLSLTVPLPRERAPFACVRLFDANGASFLTLPVVVERD